MKALLNNMSLIIHVSGPKLRRTVVATNLYKRQKINLGASVLEGSCWLFDAKFGSLM